ncbi:hypothetical protein ONE63_004347 [Megalurothrips usitatus]|uniref:C2H2-type domain-containing protein n=1 Tax=Megalurothrips usitatus TaxID=439358 RepID=A0AAV7X5M7_9NEOP|nr:hypothetical protein ONE63_004347 [Megalurothrips usitatus]
MAMDSRELDSVDLDALTDLRDVRDLHDDLHIQAAVGSDPSGRDSPGALKRAGCDLGGDGDPSTAKKRRKQSKPVRINAEPGAALAPGAAAALPGALVGAVDGALLSDTLGDMLADVDADAPVSPSLDLEVQVHCQTEAEGREEIPLNLCSLPKTEPPSPGGPAAAKTGSPGGGLDVDLSAPSQQERLAFWGMSPPFLYPMMQPDQALPPPLPQPLSQSLPQPLSQPLPQAGNHQSRCSPDNRTGSCTIFNPDAYCELCNKEFCNKYFLKTHKANKHGIFTSSPGQQPGPPQQTSPSSAPTEPYQHGLPRTLSPSSDSLVKLSSSPIRLQKDTISAKHSKNLFQRKIKVKSFGSNGDDGSMPPVDRVKVEDDYYDADVDRLLQGEDRQPDGREEGGEGGSAGDSNESTGILRREELPDKPVFTPEKMRSLGVINPEAFCEICCKEYCNKYFLRTHKWKRHGIAPPEGEEKESSRPAPSWLQQLHAAPLNLIMEEATGQGDAICKYCGQWFPSEQVLQVHVTFVHLTNKKDKDSELEIIPRKAEAADGEKAAGRKTEQIESIMDDMKKVQSMLFQLNTLNAGQMSVQSDDARSLNSSEEAAAPAAARPLEAPGAPCALCKKTFPDKNALQQHMQDQHWNGPQVKTERESEVGPAVAAAAQQPLPQQQPPPQPEPRPVTSAPTSSYCEICNKELCNKYFMKTHMQRMHGIEIENGSQIGGVVCDICNKELCSKYFLRVHKQNTHGIVDESSGPPTQARGDSASLYGSHFLDANNQALKPTDLSEMSHRYFTHFNEVCSICNRRFRSVKWLKAHLMNDHGRSEYEAAAEANDRLSKLPPGPPPPGLDLGLQLGLGPPPPPARERSREGKGRHRMDGNPHSGKNGNHYMSSLMQAAGAVAGAVAGGSSKEFRCSYCPFSTPVLAFLALHEKTHHAGLAYLPDQKRELQCPICFKVCSKPEQFQRHVLSHQFAGLPGPGAMFAGLDPRSAMYSPHKELKRERPQPQPPPPRGTPEREDDNTVSELDDRVSDRVSDRAASRGTVDAARPRDGEAREKRAGKCPKCAGDMISQGFADRCAACGYLAEPGHGPRRDRDLSSLQSLLKETVTSDVKKRLEDAAKLNDIPASYAVPKMQDADSDPFIMQPFIIEEPRVEEDHHGVVGGPSSLDKKFVPSLVFLPVKERLSRPLTASFTLTPA